jgi:hypothetical protein
MAKISVWSALISLLIAFGGCENQKHGLLTLVEPALYEATVDFSALASGGSAEIGAFAEADSGARPDLIFRIDTLEAPYGIQAVADFQMDIAPDNPCGYGVSLPIDCIDAYVQLFDDYSPQVSDEAFQESIPRPFVMWPLLVIRTSEGDQVALLHVGSYAGGLNREHFFWIYLPVSRIGHFIGLD